MNFSEFNSTESKDYVEFVEYYFWTFSFFRKLLKIVFYKL